MWDAGQYLKYVHERSRPFFDLLARIANEHVRRVVDLGCGPGNLTRAVHDCWPAAQILGVDISSEMLEQAYPLAVPGKLEFTEADIATWSSAEPLDVIISNAALQWVGDHENLLSRLIKMLAPGGSLAIQMPFHFAHPAHLAIEDTRGDTRWRHLLDGVGLHQQSVMPLAWYIERLHDADLTVDAWETTYVHVLTGENPVLEWYKGTALRPLLNVLPAQSHQTFLDELGGRLRRAYPSRAGITLMPFPRLFFVATRK